MYLSTRVELFILSECSSSNNRFAWPLPHLALICCRFQHLCNRHHRRRDDSPRPQSPRAARARISAPPFADAESRARLSFTTSAPYSKISMSISRGPFGTRRSRPMARSISSSASINRSGGSSVPASIAQFKNQACSLNLQRLGFIQRRLLRHAHAALRQAPQSLARYSPRDPRCSIPAISRRSPFSGGFLLLNEPNEPS